MVVDDSVVIRGIIRRALELDVSLKVTAVMSDGALAVQELQRASVDVIVLDIEMPNMDGLTAIPKLKAIDPAVQIIMASTLTQKNAEISLKAMSLGAADYVAKPSTTTELNSADDFKRELVDKVKALGALARRCGVRLPAEAKATVTGATVAPLARSTATPSPRPAAAKTIALTSHQVPYPNVIAIGSSTGGPQALFQVIKDMGKLPQPVVITQHMPAAFTTILADHIAKQCGVTCSEAVDGEALVPGHYYVAPGDFHMQFEKSGANVSVKLAKTPPENYCRPAVDPMLRSLTEIYGRNILAAILTGMGSDGAKGGELVVKAGGAVIAQDEASSVVWGMPGAAATAGICSAVLPLKDIGTYIRKIATRSA
jgi:two-component system chemotaxis response regulator CheB